MDGYDFTAPSFSSLINFPSGLLALHTWMAQPFRQGPDMIRQLGRHYSDAWVRKAIINVACSGKFSSDRTIAKYAVSIWNAEPCSVFWGSNRSSRKGSA